MDPNFYTQQSSSGNSDTGLGPLLHADELVNPSASETRHRPWRALRFWGSPSLCHSASPSVCASPDSTGEKYCSGFDKHCCIEERERERKMGVVEEPTKLPTFVQEASEGEAKRADAVKDQLENTDATGKTMLESVTQRRTGFLVFFKDVRYALKLDDMGGEVARIAVPAALALAADPLASLVDTAFIGRIGAIELAAVGVSIAVFNQVSKIAIYPIVSVTTSFVAEEHAVYAGGINGEENEDTEKASAVINSKTDYSSSLVDNNTTVRRFGYKRKYIPSVSSALVVGGVLGFLQAILLIFAAKPFLRIMGVKPCMLIPALRYLSLRALGAPAVLLSLAMQGVFRGFKDTKTPLYATVAGDVTNTILDAILILVLDLGVTGAAIAHVISQYLISGILLLRLINRVKIMPSTIKDLKFSRFLTCGVFLLARVIAVSFCVTLSASVASHRGPIPMAAFQICLQVWLSTSLLADGLAVAGQAILASSFARGDHQKVVAAASRVLQLSVVLGLVLSALLGIGMQFGSGIFSKDKNVLKLVHTVLPFVAATQPINSLAFVFDGINFGASDYVYSAYSMVLVAIVSIISLFLLSSSHGFVGIWIALTIYISLRTCAGVWRQTAIEVGFMKQSRKLCKDKAKQQKKVC
ncbi:hypothetical protein Taro_011543 [Colocasia esculenta]|uniref:Protein DETOXIFICATION n=1 Tax=Colocasia esculenta TaxID=4460 RepID=A0A843U650_COLES|nr:hypothetical protein [Colocasia esculenta]